jgi:thioesterase domain-containing protein
MRPGRPPGLTRLLSTFPIAKHLGVRVLRHSEAAVVLAAPLGPNRNRSGTAFAGSINALATLAGWSWVTLLLQHQGATNAQLVLQDSSISYLRPVTKGFQATCLPPSQKEIAVFLATLRRRGRARLRVAVQVVTSEGPVADYSGRYVAQLGATTLSSGPDHRSHLGPTALQRRRSP